VAEIVKLFGKTLRALATAHSSKEKKYAQIIYHKSAYTVWSSVLEGVKMLKDWAIRSQASSHYFKIIIIIMITIINNERGRFNDCKAYHASGIYSLAPRETVLVFY